MKSLKLSFIASITLIIIGVSFSANAGWLKQTILAPEDFCYTTQIGSKILCGDQVILITAQPCQDAALYVNRALFTLSTFPRFPISEYPVLCPGGNSFCCVEIKSILGPICLEQPQFNLDGNGSKYYKITAIHCMP